MIRAQFRIRLPEGFWVTDLSQTFPDATFRLLAGYRLDETAIELGEIVSDEPDAIAEALRSHPAISGFELLESEDRRALGKYETTDAELYEFVERSALPVEFPVVARDGWFEFDLTGPREELDQLRSVLENSDVDYELQSVVRTAETEALLTDRQRELLESAIRNGYYDVPRGCTLAELAETNDIDKSTASTILRRGESSVLTWFLTGPERTGKRLR